MQKKNNEIVKKTSDITDQVLNKIKIFQESGDLKIHKDYHPENALKSAYLILSQQKDAAKKPVLESCSKESIANALLEMVTQGLSPMRKQCYFIPYAGKLEFQRSYNGAMAIVKRDAWAKSIVAQAVYAKDKFSFSVDAPTGIKTITKHEQSLESIDSEVVGAYCIITFQDDSKHVEIMTIDQIKAAWAQRKGEPMSPAHKKFSDEMAKKTVINRACKPFINTISDFDIYDENEKPVKDMAKESLKNEIEETTEKTIEFEEAEIVEETKEAETKEENKEEEPF
jgi:recombination protein RecT